MGRNFALTMNRVRESAALYESGLSLTAISVQMGVSVGAVANALRMYGSRIRGNTELHSARKVTIEDIKARCEVDEKTECWNWKGCVQDNGYGRITVKRKTQYTHRLAYQLATGKPLGKKLIRHDCDNRICCNPDHLLQGTHKDNSRDAVERGRVSRGIKHSLAVTPGIRRQAKLSIEIARQIRARHADGERTDVLAKEYQTDKSNICLIVRNDAWREASTMPQ